MNHHYNEMLSLTVRTTWDWPPAVGELFLVGRHKYLVFVVCSLRPSAYLAILSSG